MSYIVLARKYRPQNFEALVGQKSVSQTLSNALQTGRIAHAYIFSGPRGVGKTTTARVLAKCLNCVQGPTISPCQKCEPCRSIGEGTSMQDVLEIDGASNRGIEQIRELRDNVKYAPSSSRYRIFIIDEAHQITKDAFGALLKTLEEPPDHVIFMMATTEVHKIPAPILSRCQRFSLRPISSQLVFDHLKNICLQEKISIEDGALKDIVHFTEGSLRDTLSLLDQALVYSSEKISTETLRELLGLLPIQTVRLFADCLREGDPKLILKTLEDLIQNGVDMSQLAKDLQAYFHRLMLAKAGVQEVADERDPDLLNDINKDDFGSLERRIRLLSRAQEDMRHSDTPRAVFEIYALRLGQKTMDSGELLKHLEALGLREKQEPTPLPFRPTANPQGNPGPLPKKPDLTPAQTETNVPSNPPQTPLLKTPGPTPQKSPEKASSPTPLDENLLAAGWGRFLKDLSQKKQALAASLEDAEPSINHNTLLLSFSQKFNQEAAVRAQEFLLNELNQFFGTRISLETNLVAHPPKPTSAKENTPATAPKSFSPTPLKPESEENIMEEISLSEVGPEVKKAVQFFPGTLKKIKKTP